MTENKNYMHRYAMQLGTYMGLFWIGKFVFFVIGLQNPICLILFFILTLCVPFLGYYYARIYRDRACDGFISMSQAWVFTLFMFMFAALLTAAGHYIYFRYIDNGYVFDTYDNILSQFKKMNMKDIDATIEQFKMTLDMLRTMNPIEIIMQLLSQNIFYCSILAIPIALCVKRKKKLL